MLSYYYLLYRWPLIIDSVGVCGTFLRHRDVNYLEALNPDQMEPEKIRKAIIGAVK